MTAASDFTSKLVRDLIRSCEKACESFRMAASAAQDDGLKHLFNLYALQRTRFAEELRQNIPCLSEDVDFSSEDADWISPAPIVTDTDLLAHCRESDERLLNGYSKLLAQKLAPRQHFFLSAQYSLLLRVHERIASMLGSSGKHTGAVITFESIA